MNEPIKVGDLVVVVLAKSCCGKITNANGHIYKVESFVLSRRCCAFCGKYREDMLARGHGVQYEVYRLHRIPPLSELESQQDKQEITV